MVCNPFRNAVDGQKNKPDGAVISETVLKASLVSVKFLEQGYARLCPNRHFSQLQKFLRLVGGKPLWNTGGRTSPNRGAQRAFPRVRLLGCRRQARIAMIDSRNCRRSSGWRH